MRQLWSGSLLQDGATHNTPLRKPTRRANEASHLDQIITFELRFFGVDARSSQETIATGPLFKGTGMPVPDEPPGDISPKVRTKERSRPDESNTETNGDDEWI